MLTLSTITLSAAAILLAASAHAQAGALQACAHRATGQLRIVENGPCLPQERSLQLAAPGPTPDTIPLPLLGFLGLRGATGDDANAVPFNPHMAIRATLGSVFDSRSSISVRAANSWNLNPDYVYDGFYVCLGFSPEIADAESLSVTVEHTRYRRQSATEPVIATRNFATLNSTVSAFRAGAPSQGTAASCLTFPFSQLIATPSGPFGAIGDTIAGPGLFSVTLSTPPMLASKPNGPLSQESTSIIGLGLTVAGRNPAP